MTVDQRRRLNAMLMAEQYNRPTPHDATVTERAGLLPIGTYANGMTGLALPGFVTEPVESFNRLMQNGYTPGDARGVEDAFNVAGGAMMGGIAAPKPSGIVGSAGGKMAGEKGVAAGAAVNALDNANVPGIRAYHGSPYDFDKFDMSKIGTGEGAQVYGHGLYFADNELTADWYRRSISKERLPDESLDFANRTTIDGNRRFDRKNMADVAAQEIDWALGDRDQTIRQIMRDIKLSKGDNPEYIARRKEVLKHLENGTETQFRSPGHTYEVNIKANPDDFLDWDKPLSQQSEKVRGILEATGRSDASEAYRQLANDRARAAVGGSNNYGDPDYRGASQALRDAGIPGIRYLDQGSRDAGNGTSNYVVFDDKLIEILRKYGLLGMAGGAAAAEFMPGGSAQPSKPSWNAMMRPGDA
jgi:hypothetical protein